jgi:hypothetical protein
MHRAAIAHFAHPVFKITSTSLPAKISSVLQVFLPFHLYR